MQLPEDRDSTFQQSKFKLFWKQNLQREDVIIKPSNQNMFWKYFSGFTRYILFGLAFHLIVLAAYHASCYCEHERNSKLRQSNHSSEVWGLRNQNYQCQRICLTLINTILAVFYIFRKVHKTALGHSKFVPVRHLNHVDITIRVPCVKNVLDFKCNKYKTWHYCDFNISFPHARKWNHFAMPITEHLLFCRNNVTYIFYLSGGNQMQKRLTLGGILNRCLWNDQRMQKTLFYMQVSMHEISLYHNELYSVL